MVHVTFPRRHTHARREVPKATGPKQNQLKAALSMLTFVCKGEDRSTRVYWLTGWLKREGCHTHTHACTFRTLHESIYWCQGASHLEIDPRLVVMKRLSDVKIPSGATSVSSSGLDFCIFQEISGQRAMMWSFFTSSCCSLEPVVITLVKFVEVLTLLERSGQ